MCIVYTGNPAIAIIISVPLVLLLLLLLVITFHCVFKKRRTRRKAAKVTKSDGENPNYGDYSDSDLKMEVKDSNAYYSSDYEAGMGGSRATDNNPYYE